MFFMMGVFTAEYGPVELEALLESIAKGDQDALAALYDHARGAVYGLALSYLKNGHDADDVAQDTFVRIWEKAPLYRPQGSPMAWILTIARNLSYGRLRRAKWEAAEEDIPEEAEDTTGLSEQTENRMILQTALQVLGDDERQIVMLHAVSGLKHREIAQLLGLSLSGTLSKYHRALAKLQKQIGGMKHG